MKITIDPSSGFCFGVKNAIELAENQLKIDNSLNCLGEIVHNPEEINRLKKEGLNNINHKDLKRIKNAKIFLRAHGEPPSTYELAKQNQLEIIDATCPIVLKLQKKVKKASEEMNELDGQVVLFGSKNHPEMFGLLGQTNNSAIVIEKENDLEQINYKKPIRLFSQTTKSTEEYQRIIEKIKNTLESKNRPLGIFNFTKSVCGQVANRAPDLKKFCEPKDIIIFVSGKNSSNGKYLFSVCQSVNSKCYLITSEKEINPLWFKNQRTVGISGATSTPMWLLEKVAKQIEMIFQY